MDQQALDALSWAECRLKELLSESGAVLFSGIDTLAPGPLYVMGFNPGGDAKPVDGDGPQADDTIAHSLATRQTGWNSWTCDKYGAGQTPSLLQKRIQTVFDHLGVDPRKTFSTNALFVRSRNAQKVDNPWQKWWDVCWPVHQHFLAIVRPSVIVCLGNGDRSAWAFLRQTQSRPLYARGQCNWQDDPSETAVVGKWRPSVKFGLDGAPSLSCAVLGLPHPSGQVSAGWPLSEAARAKVDLAKDAMKQWTLPH